MNSTYLRQLNEYKIPNAGDTKTITSSNQLLYLKGSGFIFITIESSGNLILSYNGPNIQVISSTVTTDTVITYYYNDQALKIDNKLYTYTVIGDYDIDFTKTIDDSSPYITINLNKNNNLILHPICVGAQAPETFIPNSIYIQISEQENNL